MLRMINAGLVVMLIVSAFVLYSLEHALRKHERHIASLKKEIRQEDENIKLLKAEWSHLIRPERLERLATEHLELRQARPYQLVRREELAERMPDRPVVETVEQSSDPIGDMLRTLQ